MNEVIVSHQYPQQELYKEGKRAYAGIVLRVDLSAGKIWHQEFPKELYRKLIGGRGFILHFLLNELPSGADPLGPDNLLIFAAGLLTGTILLGTGRHAVGAKSPLTGGLASSEAGGWWGHELKRAGLDAVVIQGSSPEPVYLAIEDGKASLRSAKQLWGQLTADAQEMIRQELGDDKVRVAQIGPAGENQVLYAAIMHDISRAAGRSGLGAVMGSKKLKAVAVRGSIRVGLANRSQMKDTLKWISSTYQDSMGWAVEYGTSGSVKFNHDSGGLGVRNYLDGSLEGIEEISDRLYHEKLVVGRDSCSGCPVRCKIVAESSAEPEIDRRYGGPEYESLGGLGALTAIADAEMVTKANQLCAAYGLDTISTGATIAFTMECVQRSLDLEGDFKPRFGSGEDLLQAIDMIAHRKGLGDLMAQGSFRMAEVIGQGSEKFLAGSRKQELPLHDPRLKNITGLGYALSPTGADHMHNLIDNFANSPGSDVYNRLEEMGQEVPIPLFGITAEKVKAYWFEVAFKHVMDSAVICHFYPYQYHHLAAAFSAAGGWSDFDQDEINEIGWRIITMARLFILREGSTAADDRLAPRSYYKLSEGPIAGKIMPEDELRNGLKIYYRLMGWDEQGRPELSTLEKFGIESYRPADH